MRKLPNGDHILEKSLQSHPLFWQKLAPPLADFARLGAAFAYSGGGISARAERALSEVSG